MIPETTYPAIEMANLLLVSGRRLQQLVKEGAIPEPAKRGQYNLAATVQGYIRFLRARAAGKGAGYAFEKERLTKAQADLAEVQLREFSVKYVLVEEVLKSWTNWAATIRRHIINSAMSADEKHDCLENLQQEIFAELNKREKALKKEARRTKESRQ